MRRILIFIAVVALSVVAARSAVVATDIIPRPTSVVVAKNAPLAIESKAHLRVFLSSPHLESLRSFLEADSITLVDKARKANLSISIDAKNAPESYILTVKTKSATIKASDPAGAFYGLQTLLQMLDIADGAGIAAQTVTDSPRFPYRGLHIDVSRHFRTPEFIKKQIDAMARLKLNNLHLHLTDGAGWRMPVAEYPRLTQYAAWRPQRSWQEWRNNGATYCESSVPGAQGGFYTVEQLSDIIDYAAQRHITIIPEIEMPGHSEEVIAAYPEFSCNGSGSDLCPGKEATFTFLEKVLDATMRIFPSKLIHIGGDEAGKGEWHNCPDCKKRMAEEGLASVDELQSYLIKRIEKYLNAHGRSIIGWDEILDGGVAPNATVMSWRGTAGGIEAVNSGHDVIMTPGAFCYIDYTQDAPFREPVSIGGYTPLEKIYSYEPVEPGIAPEAVKHIKGVQANLWSEYITEDSHAEHMYYPRAYAIAEIAWSTPEKNYPDFRRRALVFNDILKAGGYTPFNLAEEYGNRPESFVAVDHAAKGMQVTYVSPYSEKYPASGTSALVDGLRGGWANGDGRWQGFSTDLELIVDLGKIRPLHYIGTDFFHSEGAWIHLPEEVVFAVSADGKQFFDVATVKTDVDPAYPKTLVKNYATTLNTSARYVRLRARQNPRPGAWLFLDEIIIN